MKVFWPTLEKKTNGKSVWVYNVGVVRIGYASDVIVPGLVSNVQKNLFGKIAYWLLPKILKCLCVEK